MRTCAYEVMKAVYGRMFKYWRPPFPGVNCFSYSSYFRLLYFRGNKKIILRMTGFRFVRILLRLLDASQIGHVCKRFRKSAPVVESWGGEWGIQADSVYWTLGTKGSVLPLEEKSSSKHFSAELQLGGASFPFVSQGTQGNNSLCSAAWIPFLSFPFCQLCFLLRSSF